MPEKISPSKPRPARNIPPVKRTLCRGVSGESVFIAMIERFRVQYFWLTHLLGLSGKCDRFFYIDIIDTLSQKGKETLKRINDSLGDPLQLRIIEYQG